MGTVYFGIVEISDPDGTTWDDVGFFSFGKDHDLAERIWALTRGETKTRDWSGWTGDESARLSYSARREFDNTHRGVNNAHGHLALSGEEFIGLKARSLRAYGISNMLRAYADRNIPTRVLFWAS